MNLFLKEITEQPQALEDTLKLYLNEDNLKTLSKLRTMLKNSEFEQIIFSGMGSSYFTSFAASNIFSKIGISSSVINAGELLHYNFQVLNKKTLLVCFSQSGESFEVVEILKNIPENVKCLGITNTKNSTLDKKADFSLYSSAGKEKMTSTKTFVSILLVTYIFAWYINDEWNDIKIQKIKKLIIDVEEKINFFRINIIELINFFGNLQSLQIIARGPAYASAMQSSLMFKEAVKVAATGYFGGEFRHGPIEMVQEGVKTIIFIPKGKTFEQNLKMAKDIANFGGKVLIITNSDINISNNKIKILHIPEEDEFLFSIESIIPVQLYIDEYAKNKGFEAGSFSHGAKVTAVE